MVLMMMRCARGARRDRGFFAIRWVLFFREFVLRFCNGVRGLPIMITVRFRYKTRNVKLYNTV